MNNVQESVKKVLALLPGVDCGGFGGCGHKTCEACAQAVVESGNPSLCPACNTEKVALISEIIGAAPVEVEEKIAFVKCAGSAAGKERFASAGSCLAAKESGFANGECQWGCVGVGSCIERCKFVQCLL